MWYVLYSNYLKIVLKIRILNYIQSKIIQFQIFILF